MHPCDTFAARRASGVHDRRFAAKPPLAAPMRQPPTCALTVGSSSPLRGVATCARPAHADMLATPVVIAPTRGRNTSWRLLRKPDRDVVIAPTRGRNPVVSATLTGTGRTRRSSSPLRGVATRTGGDRGYRMDRRGRHRPYEGSQLLLHAPDSPSNLSVVIAPTRGRNHRGDEYADPHGQRVVIAPTRGRNSATPACRIGVRPPVVIAPTRGRNLYTRTGAAYRLNPVVIAPTRGRNKPSSPAGIRPRPQRRHRPYEGSQLSLALAVDLDPAQSSSPLRGVATQGSTASTPRRSWSSSPLRGVATLLPRRGRRPG